MEFALEETSEVVRELAADVLERAADRHPPAGEQGETGYRPSVWKAMAEAGLLSLAVPERLGGSGLGPMAMAAVLTEVGRRAVPVPALATLAFGTLPLARNATDEQQDRLLNGLESGGVLTAAMNEPSAPMPSVPRTQAVLRGDRLELTGTKTNVVHADVAQAILVSATHDGNPALVVVQPDARGLTRTAAPMSGEMSGWTVHFDHSPAELIGTTGAFEDLHRCALAGMCALGDGAVSGALDLTAEHLRTRTQFGKPLATFQAVAGQVADVYVTARTLHLAALSASWRLDDGRDADDDLAVAALWLAEEAPAAMHVCHHLHGGLGVDTTYPMHRHYSLIKDLSRLVGGVDHRVDTLADRLPTG